MEVEGSIVVTEQLAGAAECNVRCCMNEVESSGEDEETGMVAKFNSERCRSVEVEDCGEGEEIAGIASS